MSKRVAIMQPYFFPYIGYFQLINAVDTFVFYDDVNFIKRGWINRNNILINNQPSLITIPLEKPSQNKLINQTKISKEFNSNELLKKIAFAYKKAPHYSIVMPLIEKILTGKHTTISELAAHSITGVLQYLEIEKETCFSSACFSETLGQEKASRLISICKLLNAKSYINAPGGKSLYSKEVFAKNKIELYFIEPKIIPYNQFNTKFVSGLSIIDILMFNTKENIKENLLTYRLT